MRIAHISDCYLPRLGGIETQVHGLARRQVAAGHAVTVLTATPGGRGERHGAVDDLDDVPVHRLAIRLPFELPVNPFAPRDMRSILLSGRFDVVHVHAGVVSPFAYDGIQVVLDLGIPMVVTWHCLLGRVERVGRVWKRMSHWPALPIAFTAVSDLAADPLRRVLSGGGLPIDVRVLPNGVDVEAWRGALAGSGGHDAADRPVRLVSAMRLARRKRPIPLLHMAAQLRERVPEGVDLRLTILGDGPARPAIRQLLRHRGLGSWVSLPGRVDRQALKDAYWHSDVYVAPARRESFGIAALEARAAGLPVVARSDGGIREFVRDGVEGLLAADDDQMVDALARLVTDSALRQRIAGHNRTHPPLQDWAYVQGRALEEYARAARILARVG